jgi:hypothetical protein
MVNNVQFISGGKYLASSLSDLSLSNSRNLLISQVTMIQSSYCLILVLSGPNSLLTYYTFVVLCLQVQVI